MLASARRRCEALALCGTDRPVLALTPKTATRVQVSSDWRRRKLPKLSPTPYHGG